MNMTWNRALLVVLCVLLGGGGYIGYRVSVSWRLFSAEDRIAHTFHPVVEALYQSTKVHGHPPEKLSDLVPTNLDAIPTCPVVDSVSYRASPDGARWRLELRSSVCGYRRVYCWQSDHQYTQQEESRVLGRYHEGWTVLEDTD